MAGRERDASFIEVPGSWASVEEILQFAATYNAYELLAYEPAELERITSPIYDAIRRSGRVPDWLRVDLARAVLFYAYRADYFGGGYGPYEAMRTLVGFIGELSGGRVEQRLSRQSATTRTLRRGAPNEFIDTSDYSDDETYRWWFERRWSDQPSLCFIGLNPATGDTDERPRPTLDRVVGWARRAGCGAVVVVNLFAYRATNPAVLSTAIVDIIGDRNDETIRQRSASSAITLVAWGAHKLAASRAAAVLPMLQHPMCVGVTKSGAPAHPLYIPAATEFRPYP